jgi:DNA-3-methyladenine glycosylase I
MADLSLGPDRRQRCAWAVRGVPEYLGYHDEEWGRPVLEDNRLFERIVLEAFQSGLSWLTILRKREAFRAAFAGFDIGAVAAFNAADVQRLLGDAGIVRNRLKIEAAINNAQRAGDLIVEAGSLAAFFWSFRPPRRAAPGSFADIPATTPESTALAKELKRRGFRFVGPITAYATMQAAGIVDDHVDGCCVRDECERQHAVAAKRFA